MPGVEFLRGDRIALRTVEDEDVDVVQRAYNEPAFQRGFLIDVPRNRSAVESSLERDVVEDDDSVYLLVCADGEALGGISLRDVTRHHAMLAYWLLPEHRGAGYVREAAAVLLDHAFDSMGLHRVFAWTVDDNERSQRVLEGLGFAHEGTYREHVFARGEYHDTDHYGLLANEWDGAESVLGDDGD